MQAFGDIEQEGATAERGEEAGAPLAAQADTQLLDAELLAAAAHAHPAAPPQYSAPDIFAGQPPQGHGTAAADVVPPARPTDSARGAAGGEAANGRDTVLQGGCLVPPDLNLADVDDEQLLEMALA